MPRSISRTYCAGRSAVVACRNTQWPGGSPAGGVRRTSSPPGPACNVTDPGSAAAVPAEVSDAVRGSRRSPKTAEIRRPITPSTSDASRCSRLANGHIGWSAGGSRLTPRDCTAVSRGGSSTLLCMPPIEQISDDAFAGSTDSGPAAEVRRIAEACDDADGVITLNEQACLQLKYRGLRDASLWLGDGGFALLHGQILDLAVHPDSRGQGVGTALAAAAVGAVDRVEAWSHADHPGAARIATRFGIPKE